MTAVNAPDICQDMWLLRLPDFQLLSGSGVLESGHRVKSASHTAGELARSVYDVGIDALFSISLEM